MNGNLYSTSFCISAILEWEFRSDSISRCFCCWRLVRPAGDPAAEDDALLARGKSQLILLGSRPEALEGSGLLLLAQSSLSPATEHGRRAGGRVFSPTPGSRVPWLRRDELPRRAAGKGPEAGRTAPRPDCSRPAPARPSVRPGAARPPGRQSPAGPASRVPRPLGSRVIMPRPRQDVRGATAPRSAARLQLTLSPFLGREVSMGHPLPPSAPPPPPPPPPPGAISMARRKRRSASAETQVHK